MAVDFLFGQALAHCDHRINKRFDGYYTLQLMTAGEVSLKIGQRNWQLSGPWVWSCYPGVNISFHPANPQGTWNHRYIAFRGEIISRWISAGIYPIEPQKLPSGIDLVNRFDSMLSLFLSHDSFSQIRASHLLQGILLDLQLASKQMMPDSLVERAIAILHESDYRLGCKELAMRLDVSTRTMQRRFLSAIGETPGGHILRYRHSRAKRLLAETTLPIKRIAEQLGYRDIFFFTRQFSGMAGVSPGQYRRSCLG